MRETRAIHRVLDEPLPRASGGSGVWLVDDEGRRYLDGSGGAAVSCLGHNHPRIVQAICEQAGRLSFAHSGFFSTGPMEELARFLVDRAPGMARAGFVSGGSEANEAAVKLVRQHWIERGEPDRTVLIARHQSYHGATLGALSLSGYPKRRDAYAPWLNAQVDFIPPCFPFRCRHADESELAYAERAAEELESCIQRQGPGRVAGFIAETVVGATAGCVVPAPGYFRRIREICRRHGVLLIADEIMCGMGRTGSLFAYEQEDFVPDLVTVAKGLAGGYQPIGAVLASAAVLDPLRQGSGAVLHGHTYMGHTLACATALEVQRTIVDDRLLERVQEMGHALSASLRRRFEAHTHVGDIRGRGLFQAIEIVENRRTGAPFDPGRRLHLRVKHAAMRNGLICYPGGGTIDGNSGDHILLAPPFIVSREDIDEIVRRLGIAIDEAIAGAHP